MLSERATNAEVIIDPKVAHQVELERLFNKNQVLQRIRSEFLKCEDFKFLDYMVSKDIDPEFGLDLIVQMVLRKRTTLSTLVGILRKHYEDKADASQHTANMLLKAAEADLVDWDPTLRIFILVFNISETVQQELDRFQYPLPMVVPPHEVRDNHDTGYLMTRNSIILRRNHHDDDVCLDHINRVNRVAFSIDHDTAHMIKGDWRNLDKPKLGETQRDFQKRVKAFEKYDRTAKDVIDLLLTYGNKVYLTHKYDKRGRTYCQGYHVNYQGAPWNKAVIELHDKEVVPL